MVWYIRIMGRPSSYTAEIAAQICDRLSVGEPLAQICRDEGMPGLSTVYDWRDADASFAGRFARAREAGFDHIATDALAILDAAPERVVTMTGDDRTESRIDSAAVAWSKNRFEGRLKLLAKWDPKRYGERLTHAGDPEAPVEVRAITRRIVDPGTNVAHNVNTPG